MKTTTVHDLARELASNILTDARWDGELYLYIPDESPPWMHDVLRLAHDGMGLDDWRTAFVLDACKAIADHPNEWVGDAVDLMEGSSYIHDLTDWLHSRPERSAYVDQAREVWGVGDSLIDDLKMGQQAEMSEVFDFVLRELLKLVETR